MTALTPDLSTKLAKIAGMFGSAHDGERAAAAALADRLVRGAGLTWPDILRPSALPPPRFTAPPPQPWTPAWTPPPTWRNDVAACLKRRALFNGWETTFLEGLPRFPHLSAKQREILDRLVERARVAGGAP